MIAVSIWAVCFFYCVPDEATYSNLPLSLSRIYQEESGSVFPSLSGIWVMQIGGRIWLSNKNSFRAPANEKQQNAPARIQAHKRQFFKVLFAPRALIITEYTGVHLEHEAFQVYFAFQFFDFIFPYCGISEASENALVTQLSRHRVPVCGAEFNGVSLHRNILHLGLIMVVYGILQNWQKLYSFSPLKVPRDDKRAIPCVLNEGSTECKERRPIF
ncbi:hypothetical protein RHMOL_Rhmol06G0257900 [Rhododendron molle]|nr:hypothetical protein RHMOL_Rhmol06G0257900 [Rhododendron molle]KAI8552326.1 hypothetical protein RHMOL_Rhmol06G0257900 [Rhododendron molle]